MYQDNPNINENGYIYAKWKINENTYMIRYNNMYSYLLIGSQRALVIDTFYGHGNLRQFVESLTDKPTCVANTHGHFDHTGGNAWCPEVYVTEESSKDMKIAFSENEKALMARMPYPDYQANLVKDGDKIDLGGRFVEVITIGCHHPGSMALLDSETHFLFTGDELESGQVLLGSGGPEKIALHKANMEKLYARIDEIAMIGPAHNGSPLSKEYIHDYLVLLSLIHI